MNYESSISHRQRQSLRVLTAVVALAAGLFGPAQANDAATGPGPSASSLQRIDVSGRMAAREPRTQVSVACPGYGAQLQDQLEVAALRSAQAGNLRVEFILRDGLVDGLSVHGGPVELRRPVRRAMAQLKCPAIGEPQHYAFVVGINTSPAQDSGSRVVLLSEDPHSPSAGATMDAALR